VPVTFPSSLETTESWFVWLMTSRENTSLEAVTSVWKRKVFGGWRVIGAKGTTAIV